MVRHRASLRKRQRRLGRWLGRFAIALLVLAIAAAVTVFFVVRHYEKDLPSVAELRKGYDPPQVTRVLARDGTLLANLFTQRRTVGEVRGHPQTRQAGLPRC